MRRQHAAEHSRSAAALDHPEQLGDLARQPRPGVSAQIVLEILSPWLNGFTGRMGSTTSLSQPAEVAVDGVVVVAAVAVAGARVEVLAVAVAVVRVGRIQRGP